MTQSDPLFDRFGKAYPKGSMLFEEGEAGRTMYVLRKGTVRLTKRIRSTTQTLAVLGAGEFFGEMAILNDSPRTATAEAVEDTEVLAIDARTFETMVKTHTEIAVRLMRKMAERLAAANGMIETLMLRDPEARVILALSREAEFLGRMGSGPSVVIPLGIPELAAQLGLSEDEVRGVTRRLLRLGLIEQSAEGLRILDFKRLHEFLEFVEIRRKAG